MSKHDEFPPPVFREAERMDSSVFFPYELLDSNYESKNKKGIRKNKTASAVKKFSKKLEKGNQEMEKRIKKLKKIQKKGS